MRRAAAAASAAVLLLAGCGHGKDAAGSKPSPSATMEMGGRGQLGDLQISAAYVPEPASPSVAAAYVTVRNTGPDTDTLIRASTPAGKSTTLHRDVTSGGSEGMVALRSVPIPAGKSVAMKPGGIHLMIEHPRSGLTRGGQVELTLVFAHAGRLTMQVPIVSPAGLNDGMPDMPGMPGMGG
jgi:hypothetical protein